MTRKTLTALLFVFILSACGSNVDTIPISTLLPTLSATSTFTPEPTATNTPIPTDTPFQYTSCVHPELMNEVKDNAVKVLGMTASEYFEELLAGGDFAGNFKYNEDGEIFGRVFIAGAAEVSLANLPGFSKDDVARCIFVSSEENPDVMIPVVHSFTQNGEYNRAFIYTDRTEGEVKYNTFYTMDEERDFFGQMGESVIGDVIWLYIRRFGEGATDEDFTTIDPSKMGYAANIAKLTAAMEKDYLSRVEAAGGHPLEMMQLLDPESGDIGLFVRSMKTIKKRH